MEPREKKKRASFFSTFRKKFDLFNWKPRIDTEEPVLLCMKKKVPEFVDEKTLHGDLCKLER